MTLITKIREHFIEFLMILAFFAIVFYQIKNYMLDIEIKQLNKPIQQYKTTVFYDTIGCEQLYRTQLELIKRAYIDETESLEKKMERLLENKDLKIDSINAENTILKNYILQNARNNK